MANVVGAVRRIASSIRSDSPRSGGRVGPAIADREALERAVPVMSARCRIFSLRTADFSRWGPPDGGTGGARGLSGLDLSD